MAADVYDELDDDATQDPEVAVNVFTVEPRSDGVSKTDEILESISSTDPATVIFPNAETTEANVDPCSSSDSVEIFAKLAVPAVCTTDLMFLVGVEFARKLHAGFKVVSLLPVSVVFFLGI